MAFSWSLDMDVSGRGQRLLSVPAGHGRSHQQHPPLSGKDQNRINISRITALPGYCDHGGWKLDSEVNALALAYDPALL